MSDRFWSVIARTNAHLYSILAIIFLLIAVLWVLRPVDSGLIEIESRNGTAEGSGTSGPRAGSGCLSGIEALTPDPSLNPFDSEYLRKVNAQLRWAEQAAAAAKSAAEKEEPPREKPDIPDQKAGGSGGVATKPAEKIVERAPPKSAQPRLLRVTYRGMITDLDGSSRALVENLESGSSSYYHAGDRIEWAKLLGFSPKTMRISAAGEDYLLRRGIPFQIEEQKGDERE